MHLIIPHSDQKFVFKIDKKKIRENNCTKLEHTYYWKPNGEKVKLLKPLGEGAFGKVYVGLKGRTEMAVKVIRHVDGAGRDKGIRNVQKEVDLMAALEKTSWTPRVYGIGSLPGCSIIEMELLGPSLKEQLLKVNNGRGFSRWETLEVSEQIFNALRFIHSKGITHGDISTANICVMGNNVRRIKIMDFGCAQWTQDLSKWDYSHVCAIVMSAPEVILLDPLTEKIDVWAAGCVMAEMFIGNNYLFDVNSREELFWQLEAANLLPENVHMSYLYGELVLTEIPSYSGPMFTDLFSHLMQNGGNATWSTKEKTDFIQRLCKIVAADRPTAAGFFDMVIPSFSANL